MSLSLSFRGVRKPYLTVLSRKRRYWAPRQILLQEKIRVGSRIKRVKRGVRIEEVTVEIASDSANDLRGTSEDLANWLLTDSVEELIFDDEKNRKYMAIVDGSFEPDEIVSHGYGVVKFLVPESAKRGASKSLNLSTTSANHTITGQTETPWTVEVTFTESANRFELWAGDIYLQLNYSFIEGDKLVIEYTGRKVTLNGNDLRKAVSMSCHFEEMKPGIVSVRASHTAVLKYDERYY